MSIAIRPADNRRVAARSLWLWLEFLLLFGGLPLAMATILPTRWAFPTLAVMTLVGLALLGLTPGFRWRRLLPRRLTANIGLTLGFALVAGGVIYAVVLWKLPGRLFALPTHRTELWLMILALYPLLSVLPQELLYRALFFERYGKLFGSPQVAMLANAAAFGLGHMFYGNWIAVTLSTLGGYAFAYAYVKRDSFPLAVLWHTLAGQLVFTIGLGLLYYHGAIPAR